MSHFSWVRPYLQTSGGKKKLYWWFVGLLIFASFIWFIREQYPPQLDSANLVVQGSFTISYADSVAWLDTVPKEDRDEQIRDWTLWGLASILKLDVTTVRNAMYDRSPIRDAAINDVFGNSTGPGRAILDNQGTLHLLVPEHDPYLARSIGMTLDDVRKDRGEDPKQVVLYHYEILYEAHKVELSQYAARPMEDVREQYGYVEMPVNTTEDLTSFLQQTQHLSQIKVVQGRAIAGGWRWPGAPNVPITAADIAVLQRGYRIAQKTFLDDYKRCELFQYINSPCNRSISGREPGFSLDSGRAMSVRELLPILIQSSIYPELKGKEKDVEEIATFIEEWENAQTITQTDSILERHWKVTDEIIANGTSPDDMRWCHDNLLDEYYNYCLNKVLNNPEHPWQLMLHSARGIAPYQLARYDGNIGGTEAGYTYFYTDLVAKAWLVVDRGTGNPYHLDNGFIPNPQAETPKAFCSNRPMKGRLWFDLGKERISILADEVNLGSVVTRVFTRMDDPNQRFNDVSSKKNEVESSYKLGRGEWWWDRHYLSIADYEPQYQRLDQLLRWSAAIAWLINKNLPLLPEVESIQSNRTFGEWLANRYELRWKFLIPFLKIPGEERETLLRLYAQNANYSCGQPSYWSGGVSGPGLDVIKELSEPRPVLPEALQRSNLSEGLLSEPSVSSSKAILKTLDEVDIALESPTNDVALMRISATGSKVWHTGDLNLSDATRNFSMKTAVNPDQIDVQVNVQDDLLAEVSIKSQAKGAQVQVKPGVLAEIRPILETFQEQLYSSPAIDVADIALQTPGVRVVYEDVKARLLYVQVENGNSPAQWLVMKEGKAANEKVGFYFTQPDEKAPEGVIRYNAQFSEAPKLGADGQWVKVVGNVDTSAIRLESVNVMPANLQKFTVRFAVEGRASEVAIDGDGILLQATDSILNAGNNSVHGFLYNPVVMEQISKLQGGALVLDDGGVILAQGEQKLFLPKSFWDEIATTNRQTGHTVGDINIGNPVELANKQTSYPLSIGNEAPVVVQVAKPGDDMVSVPYQVDIIKLPSTRNQSISLITGRSASIRVRQGEVIQASEPGTTFVYMYEINEGNQMGVQIGKQSVQLDISWETLLDDLNQHEVPKPLISAMQAVKGQIVLVADSKLDQRIRISNPDYVAAVDQPTLVTVLDEKLEARLFSGDDLSVVKSNLLRLEPMRVDNTAIVIDTPSLTPKQAPLIDSMITAIRAANIPIKESQIVRSLDKIPDAKNIILITAENDAELTAKLAMKGDSGELKDKFVLIAACGNESVCNFVTGGSVKQYGAIGFGVFRDQIYAETLPQFVPELFKVSKENPTLYPDQVINTAVERLNLNFQQKQPAMMNWLETSGINIDLFREGLERLRNIFYQLSLSSKLQV